MHRHPVALLGEGTRDGGADAAGGAGDEDGAVPVAALLGGGVVVAHAAILPGLGSRAIVAV